MHAQGHLPNRLPSEWLSAIHKAQKRTNTKMPELPEPSTQAKDDVPLCYEHSPELRTLIHRLKRLRTKGGLSLGAVARKTDQARSALSRLESGEYSNPTLNTLYRYAHALGWQLRFSLHPLPGDEESDGAAVEADHE